MGSGENVFFLSFFICNSFSFLEMRQEIAVWRRAAGSLSSYSRDEDIVRKALEKKV